MDRHDSSSHICRHDHNRHGASGRIGVAFFVNFVFTLIELLGAYLTNSLAIMSDAIHDLGDSLSLGLAWWLERYSLKRANSDHTYGYRRWSSLSALISSVAIMTTSILIIAHSAERLFRPEPVSSIGVIGLAILGVAFNLIGFFKLRGGATLNEKVLKYHLLEDVLSWVVVLIGGIAVYLTNWYWLDPLLASGIAIWIFRHVWTHFKASLKVFMQRWPEGLPIEQVEFLIKSFWGVKEVHHLHGWSIDGEQHIVTMHIVLKSDFDKNGWPALKIQIKTLLKDKWNVIEATLESEIEDELCLDPSHDSRRY